jgi:hypothetical protein
MTEQVFQTFLQKFKVVRSRDAYVAEPSRSRSAASRTVLSASPSSSRAGGALLADAAPLAPDADFWTGLSAFLATRFPPAQAKSVAAAFDEEHYA